MTDMLVMMFIIVTNVKVMICITMVHPCGFEIRAFKVHTPCINIFSQMTNLPGRDAVGETEGSQVKHWLCNNVIIKVIH